MKKYTLIALCLCSYKASALNMSEVIDDLEHTYRELKYDVRKGIRDLRKRDRFCGKGDLANGVVTIRSLDGNLCAIPYLSDKAFEECKGYPGFSESKCADVLRANGYDI